MSDLLRDDVLYTLGPVADAVVADIIRSGASMLELQEARVWQAQNRALAEDGNRPRHPAGPVGDVLDILEELEADEPRVSRAITFEADDIEILPPDRLDLPHVLAPELIPAATIENCVLAQPQPQLASRRMMLLTTTRM